MNIKKKVNVKGEIDLSDYTIINIINDDYAIIAESDNIFFYGVVDANGNIIIECKYLNVIYTGEVFICKNLSSPLNCSCDFDFNFSISFSSRQLFFGDSIFSLNLSLCNIFHTEPSNPISFITFVCFSL